MNKEMASGSVKILRLPKIHGEDEMKSKLKNEDQILNEECRESAAKRHSFVIATIGNS